MRQILSYSLYWQGELYYCCIQVDYHIDRNYGANSDGNRGYQRTFIDDVHFLSIRNEQNQIIKDPDPALKEEILSKVDNHL